MGMSLRKLQETVKDREDWLAAVHRVTKSQTWISDWTTTTAMDIDDVFQVKTLAQERREKSPGKEVKVDADKVLTEKYWLNQPEEKSVL